ncbi:MAG: response regulator [Desulfobacteraceae bacterium]|nr:MAG: response regulator [Desulfobacteraceae bacterium]
MPRILVVDDDDSIRMFYAEELGEEGYDVLTCGDGDLLLDRIEHDHPDLVVLNRRVGKHSGLELLKKIRKRAHSLPVILCTVSRVDRYERSSLAADYYIVKSADLGELKHKIKTALVQKPNLFMGLRKTGYPAMTAHG